VIYKICEKCGHRYVAYISGSKDYGYPCDNCEKKAAEKKVADKRR
jgi:hypothetical protein